ncbi:hypothetical protein HYU92_04125 [Candidatus Curtissbacteria bacterium]|nr:hypothetical protein [Candidatus Curtissbacteria bacterium]
MKFTQIAVAGVGRSNDNSAYSVALFALNENGKLFFVVLNSAWLNSFNR